MSWWFEDAIPGGTIHHPRGRTIDADEHARLAWLTDNASAVHGDDHRSAAGAYGRTVVLGALTAAVAIGLAEPGTPVAAQAVRAMSTGWSRIELTAVVVGGDTIAARSTIVATTPDPDGLGGRVQRTIEGQNQHGDVVVRVHEERWIAARAR